MLTVISDTHIGAVRSTGTTPVTQWNLRVAILNQFKELLPDWGDLLVNGDLFDSSHVNIYDVLETYTTLVKWLTDNEESTLYLSAGNHDLSKSSNVLSSFSFLGSLLKIAFKSRYVHIVEPTNTPYGYVIPHLANQALFDMALESVPPCKVLFLHCNYDNHFAAQADHSLNLSKEVAARLPADMIVLGHEHHYKITPKVKIVGNQIATSVSDWLGTLKKLYLKVHRSGAIITEVYKEAETEYVELDWKSLEVTDHKFVRVTGKAAAEDAGKVVSLINKLRQLSNALVITNAVYIAGNDESEYEESLSAAQGFNIWEVLKDVLTEKEFGTIQTLGKDI